LPGFEDFLADYEARKAHAWSKRGGEWWNQCAAHDDHNPSLRAKPAPDSSPLVYCDVCKAGLREVCDALGLDMRAYLPPRDEPTLLAPGDPRDDWMPGGERATAIYLYHDENGELLYRVLRSPSKQFRQCRPDPSTKSGWRWNLNGVRRVLYRLPDLQATKGSGSTVFVCEGEKDVEALVARGLFATCNPMGAGKLRSEYAEQLRGVARVVIVADKDEPGLEHAAAWRQLLEGVVPVIEIVQAREGKDAYDHLAAGYGHDEFVPVEAVPALEPPSLEMGAFIDTESVAKGALVGTLDDAIIVPGGLHIIGGKPGVGKTTFLINAILHFASGIDWLGFKVARPLNVYVIENEGPRESFRRKLQRQLEKWEHPIAPGRIRIHTKHWGVFSFANEEHRTLLREEITKHEVDLVVGDSLTRLGMKGVGSPEETTQFVELLQTVGLGADVAFLFLHHLRKAESADDIDEMRGAWGDHPDSTFYLRGMAERDRVKLQFVKLRFGEDRFSEPFILAKEKETWGFVLVGTESEVGERNLEAEILEEMAAFDTWQTAREIAAIVKASKERVQEILEALAEAGEILRELGSHPDVKRHPRAVCYRTKRSKWKQQPNNEEDEELPD
jgi:hypothetical protein